MDIVEHTRLLPPREAPRLLDMHTMVALPRPDASAVKGEPFPNVAAADVVLTGVVQGVGFRPYVHRLALKYDLKGWVRNEAGAVRIRVEGHGSRLETFVSSLQAELPPLARIDHFARHVVPAEGWSSFQVVASDTTEPGRLPVSPDVAMCTACERELRDPANRRYHYPFITCTDCGPRFTVIETMPYDRVRTTMRAFPQCPACLGEYEDPTDRRYHSETNSCPACGPRVWLLRNDMGSVDAPAPGGQDAIHAAADLLVDGGILAVRGLGGFHLAARADSYEAVSRLRRRKARDAKPLAVMVRDLAEAEALAHISGAESESLRSAERPIVVLGLRRGTALSDSVSPGLDTVGVMLAYTPLHHLLLDAVGSSPLVMTSGNVSDEPIAIGNEEAVARLGAVADAFLLHDREIVARYDDSVVKHAGHGPLVLRRSRGYAPMPVPLPVGCDEGVLAVGPHLKNTFTIGQGGDAWVSQHIGDLETLETLGHFEDAHARFRTLFHLEPRWVVRDLHPGYLSTRIAEESGLEELEPVQHHHAHIAAVMGEHGRSEPVLGLAFDGTGFGSDGRVWGCEMMVADLVDFRRVAHLRYVPLPGGDRAARSPWRSLLGYVTLDYDTEALADAVEGGWARDALAGVDPPELHLAARQISRGLNSPQASSLGRLFDAAAAVLGIRLESRYEGQAAMELEAAAGHRPGRVLPLPVRRHHGTSTGDGVQVLDPVPLLRALADGRRAGRDVRDLAADFHETVAIRAADLAVALCHSEDLTTVALGGGCFQNVRLTDTLRRSLVDASLEVLVPSLLSPNDGAVSYGQAVVAAARLARSDSVDPNTDPH